MQTRVTELLGIDLPVVQAPMAGSNGVALAIEVATAGGLGSLPCAMLNADQIRAEVATFRSHSTSPLNLNFFCHATPDVDDDRLAQWDRAVSAYYAELGLEQVLDAKPPARAPFDESLCTLVEELRPEVVSFHFGLPEDALVDRVLTTGAKVLSSATTVDEALWLEERGCSAVIAQGVEAGGHRGMFLTDDINSQLGTIALVPLVADAISLPVIAAGGISDARGVAAAFALGAEAVQVGTAYLLCPEALTSPLHRRALQRTVRVTALTNVFTGRPARSIVNRLVREVGPMSTLAPPFPLAAGALAPLRVAAEGADDSDFSPLWSGQAGALAEPMSARQLTRQLVADLS